MMHVLAVLASPLTSCSVRAFARCMLCDACLHGILSMCAVPLRDPGQVHLDGCADNRECLVTKGCSFGMIYADVDFVVIASAENRN
jgi:hypothetical protein